MVSLWNIRPCVSCGRGVRCEPDYPAAAQIICWACVETNARAFWTRSLSQIDAVDNEDDR
jgi:hypothetical protein